MLTQNCGPVIMAGLWGVFSPLATSEDYRSSHASRPGADCVWANPFLLRTIADCALPASCLILILHRYMKTRHYGDLTMDLIGRIAFPRTQPSMRRKHLRFLILSVILGLMFCSLFGCALFLLNKQGRI